MRRGQQIIETSKASVLCNAYVDLISRVQRPYLFKVTVMGLPPHTCTKVYEIAAKDDNTAALKGIERFVKHMSTPLRLVIEA